MKSLICVLALVFASASQVMAWTQYNDGGTYDITTTIADDVWVDWESPGMGTTVNMLSGGNITGQLQAYNDNYINMEGGTIGGVVRTYNNTQLTMHSGSMGSKLYCYDNTQLIMDGGTIGSVDCYDDTQATTSGDFAVGGWYITDNAQLTINNGSFYHVTETGNSQVTMQDGSIEVVMEVEGYSNFIMHDGNVGGIRSYGNSRATVTGGTVGYVATSSTDQITIAGGSITTIYADDGQVYWHDGEVSGDLLLEDQGTLVIFGSDFAIDGVPVEGNTITSIFGGDPSLEPSRRLTGTHQNGYAIDNTFHIGNTASIVLSEVPEPTTLSMLVVGSLALFFYRRR